MVGGARIAHAAPAAALRRVVATVLLSVGLLIAVQTASGSVLGDGAGSADLAFRVTHVTTDRPTLEERVARDGHTVSYAIHLERS